jgi:glutamate racemase
MSGSVRIGFFDSGLGGLSVLRHAPTRIADASYLYVADSAFAPYGDQSMETIRARSLSIARFLRSQNIDALVIACNTATALAAELVRANIDVPVVAMEPAIKPAMQQSHSRRVAVLATESTLNSERYLKLKNQHAWDGEVFERACHHWVEALEQGMLDADGLYRLVAEELRDIQAQDADTYILACTHFPFLREQIAKTLNDGERIVDPAPAVIEQLVRVLDVEPVDRPMTQPALQFFSSGDVQQVAERVDNLLGWQVQVQALPV